LKKSLTKWVGAMALLLIGPWLGAAEDEAIWIEEVTVVSTRVASALRDVPAAVSVVERADIQQGRQQLGLDEALNRVPGVFAQNRYNFAQDLRLAIRGFGARANFGIRGVKVYIDDIPATTADGQSGVDDIDLASLDRIEVTRGPFSSLYGAAAGGVVNLYSESGSEPGFLRARATVGEDGHRNYQLKAAGRGETVDYMVSVNDLTYDGYRDLSRVQSTQFNSRFGIELDERSKLTGVFNLVDSPQADDAGAITAAQADADPTQAQPRNIASNAGEEVEQQRLGLLYTRQINDGLELRLRNYYVWRDFEAFLPIGTHIPFVSDDGVVAFDRFFYGGGAQLAMTAELFGMPHRMTLGFDVDLQEDDRQRYLNNAGTRGTLSFDQTEQADSYGIYLRSELDLSDTLTLVAGLRYDEVELSVDDDFLDNADQSGSLDFDEVSPMLGLLWDLRSNATLYFNYGTSFETPTFTELASPARNLDVSLGGFANVSAQQAESFEVGLRGSFADNRVYLDVAAFTMTVDDEITNVENIGSRSFFENADTERDGLEVSVIANLSGALRLSFAYTYTDFEFDSFAANPGFAGNQLPGLPEQQLFAELRYQAANGFYVVADSLYVDEMYVNNANSVISDSSVVANLRTGFEMEAGKWRIGPFFGINNLFNEQYMANVRINGFGGRLFEPGPERNVYAGVIFTLSRG